MKVEKAKEMEAAMTEFFFPLQERERGLFIYLLFKKIYFNIYSSFLCGFD